MSRTLIAPALRHALACKGHSVRALGQTPSDFFPGTPKSLTSSSAVAVSMVVAAFLLGNPLSSSTASAVTWGVSKVNLKFEPEPV